MTTKYMVCADGYEPVAICRSRDDAAELVLSLTEEESYLDFLENVNVAVYNHCSVEEYFEIHKHHMRNENHWRENSKYSGRFPLFNTLAGYMLNYHCYYRISEVEELD